MDEGVQAEVILDHYRSPRNYGSIKDPSCEVTENNPLCGDTVHFSFLVKDGIVEDVKFVGQGCSISQAAASMMSEEIKGKKIEDILAISEKFVIDMVGLNLGPNREKCALLSLNAIQKALGGKH